MGATTLPGFRSTVLIAASLSLAFALAAGSPGFAQDRGGGSSVAVADEGREIYEQICQSCHMADAKGGGVPGAMIPALAGNPRLANHDYASIILLKGRGGMPWFEGMLTRPQIAAVLNYVRGHFNTYPDAVTVADLDRISTANPPVPDCNCGH
ncbi:MAG: cytochrome c [Sphingomonadales bacterium]|nr:alcohol dehydrogenase [Novosphingobium sp. AAP93]MBU6393714.1 cytochrome c [Sphingomonadales bacterium]